MAMYQREGSRFVASSLAVLPVLFIAIYMTLTLKYPHPIPSPDKSYLAKAVLASQIEDQAEEKRVSKKEFFAQMHSVLNSLQSQSALPSPTRSGKNSPSFEQGLTRTQAESYYQRTASHIASNYKIIMRQYRSQIGYTTAPTRGALVSIIIHKDGALHSAKVERSSGSLAYDELVMKAIRTAQPFPLIPEHLGITHFETSFYA
jgi:TonB family protein